VQTAPDLTALVPWREHGFTFTALADYALTARILHVALYNHDSWSDVCPIDFALGWGRMSDPAIYEQFAISQLERHYIWRYSGNPPIPEEEVSGHSANTHLIPGDEGVRSRLYSFQRHDVVRLEGYLVRIELPDGGNVTSSLSRTDVGDGACEVLWVKRAEKIGR
jgi:hypothetical protein